MLSQLSYAPVLGFGVAHLSDVVHYTQVGAICQELFSIFYFLFFSSKTGAYFGNFRKNWNLFCGFGSFWGLAGEKIFFTDKSA